MRRYFFHVSDGSHKPDLVGTELPDIAAVRQEALRTTGELLRDGGDHFWSGHNWTMNVKDDAGAEVLTLRFSASIPPQG